MHVVTPAVPEGDVVLVFGDVGHGHCTCWSMIETSVRRPRAGGCTRMMIGALERQERRKKVWLFCRTSSKIIVGDARHSAHRTPSYGRRRGRQRLCWPRGRAAGSLSGANLHLGDPREWRSAPGRRCPTPGSRWRTTRRCANSTRRSLTRTFRAANGSRNSTLGASSPTQ